MSRFVLDSYAILAIVGREVAAEQALDLITDHRHQFWMSSINVGEVYYGSARKRDLEFADETLIWLSKMPIVIVDAGLQPSINAAQIKAEYAIAYGDCFAAALARHMEARVVTGDPEFERLEREGVVAVEWLPRKTRR